MNSWQKIFPENPNTLNLFLLNIGSHIVEHLEGDDTAFESKIIEACQSNRFFASWRNASCGPDLMQEADASKTLKIFDLTQDYLTAIQCHDCDYDRLSREELDEKLQNFLKELIACYDFKSFLEMKEDNSLAAFNKDYDTIEKSFLQRTIEYNAAQASLLYWQDAIPELLLQEALVSLLYSRIALHLGLIRID